MPGARRHHDRPGRGGADAPPVPHQARRHLAAWLLAGCAAANCWFMLAMALPGELSPVTSFISELTATGQPHARALAWADLLTGTLAVAAVAAGWTGAARRGWLRLAGTALMIYGLCTAADARLPLECAPSADPACRAAEVAGRVGLAHHAHSVTGVAEALAIICLSLGIGMGTRYAPRWARISHGARAAAVLQVLLAGGITLIWFTGAPGVGILQRVSTVTMSATLLGVALTLRRADWPDARPPAWPNLYPEAERLEVATPGGRAAVELHHRNAGGPLVLFSNGLTLPGSLWYPVVAHLPDRAVVLFDRPGLGHSRGTAGVDLHAQVEQLAAVLRAAAATLTAGQDGQGGCRALLVAHSHGATAAEAMARLHPELVAGLVLVDPSEPRPHRRPVVLAQRAFVRVAGPVVATRIGHAVLGPVTRAWTLLLGTARADRYRPDARVHAQLHDQDHLLGALAELDQEPADLVAATALAAQRQLGDIPVRLLVGSRTGWPLYRRDGRWVAAMDRRAGELGAGRAVDLPGAHLLMLDTPVELAAEIADISHQCR